MHDAEMHAGLEWREAQALSRGRRPLAYNIVGYTMSLPLVVVLVIRVEVVAAKQERITLTFYLIIREVTTKVISHGGNTPFHGQKERVAMHNRSRMLD